MQRAQRVGKRPELRTTFQKSGPSSSQAMPQVGQTTWAEPSGRPDSKVDQPIRQPEPVVADGLGPAGEQAVGAEPIRESQVLDDQLARPSPFSHMSAIVTPAAARSRTIRRYGPPPFSR